MATYGTVVNRIRFETAHDRKIDDVLLKSTIHDAMLHIAKRCIPLTLVTKDLNDEIIRKIDEYNYIRMPFIPTGNNNEILDIDDLLVDAVVYAACKMISRDQKDKYEELTKRAINDFQWGVYESVEDGNYGY